MAEPERTATPSAPRAERDALASAGEQRAEPARGAAPTPPLPAAAQVPSFQPPPADVTPAQPTTAEAATNARQEIDVALALYARAIESRNLAQLRNAYPGLTSEQQRVWEEFFQSVRDLEASLSVEQLDLTGSTAEVRVEGSYRYRNPSLGRNERLPVTFRATLEREPGGWHLRSIR